MAKIRAKVYRQVGVQKGQPLPAFAMPEGTPVFYLDEDQCVLCAKCATNAAEFEADITDACELEKGDTEVCEECAAEIDGSGFNSVKPQTKWKVAPAKEIAAFNTRLAPPVHPHGFIS